ncbi:YtxH domain-containing protein [Flavihumibacter stibioxidans]|uniref:Gas vesicle protein n=1 Tax=Flavihumibacter stibioxidans TaxID=1834163 RepID=A0ABR7M6W5_9BACT|nr:YtxH domain-containing protein [Flavihumibacter stibioxidans]MBC6490759.1 hypothetical protein [Flavihumibacter stibioxidans]
MNDQSKFLAGLLLGAAAGAAIAYLMTTDKGKEMMEDFKTAASEAGDDLKDTVKKFETEIESAVEKGKKWASDFQDKATDLTT